MFCPQCASQNIEGAHFCRSCGANISLVPQALTGQLPVVPDDRSRREKRRDHRNRQPTLDNGVREVVTGFGFLAVAFALAIFGRPIGAQVWWFWMLLPAFGMLGKGISEIIRANQLKSSQPPVSPQLPYAAPPVRLATSHADEMRPPVVSVTEGTTRHLGTEAATEHLDSVDRRS